MACDIETDHSARWGSQQRAIFMEKCQQDNLYRYEIYDILERMFLRTLRTISMGIGRTMVWFCDDEMRTMVCRYRSWIAAGEVASRSAACFSATED